MNKRKASKLLFSVQDNYVRAIKSFERAERYSDRGHTTKALEQREKGFASVCKAEAAIAELANMIDE